MTTTAELLDEDDPESPVVLKDENGTVIAVMSQKVFWWFRNGGKAPEDEADG